MKFRKSIRYKNMLQLGIVLISYTAFLAFLFVNGGVIRDFFVKLGELLAPFVYGFVIAYLLNPAINFVEHTLLNRKEIIIKGFRVHRFLSICFVYTITLILLGLIGVIIVPQISDSIQNILKSAPNVVDNASNFINANTNEFFQGSLAQKALTKLYSWLQEWASYIELQFPMLCDYALGVASFIKNLFLGLVISIYMLIHKEKLFKGIERLARIFLKEKTRRYCVYLIDCCNRIFGNFIIAKALDSLIIGVLTYIVLLIFRIPYAMLLSVIVCITNMIPVFGPIIGGAIGAVLLVFTNLKTLVIFLILILAIQQLDGNIIGPKIIGAKLSLSALWIIFGVVVVGGLFGVTGLFIGVPLFAICFTLLRDYVAMKEKSQEDHMRDKM